MRPQQLNHFFKLGILLSNLLISQSSFSQSLDTISNIDKEPIEKIIENGIELNKLERIALFNKEFSSALSDVQSNYIGNFASVNIGETKASFSKTFVRDGSVFGFNITGGTTDGTIRLVNNNELNYNFEIGFQYHFMDKSKKVKFDIDVQDLEKRRLERKKILDDTKKKIDDLEEGTNNKELLKQKKDTETKLELVKQKINYIQLSGLKESIDKDELKVKQESIDILLKDLQDYLDYKNGISVTYKNNKDQELRKLENCFTEKCTLERSLLENDFAVKNTLVKKIELQKESKDLQKRYTTFNIAKNQTKLFEEKKKLEQELSNINSTIQYNNDNKLLLQSLESTKRREALEKHYVTAVQSYGSHFSWFSIGAKAGLKTFVLYDPEVDIDKQIKPTENYNLELTLQYSWHSYNQLKHWESYLINTGVGITYGDNLSTLNSLTLKDENIISESGNLIRTTTNETNVFVGDYIDDIAGIRFYTDIYYFLFKGNVAALHLYPTANFIQNEAPLFNTQVGILFSYKDRDKPNTIINTELFYSFNDIGNKLNSELNFLGRNTLGLRLTLPINFKYQP